MRTAYRKIFMPSDAKSSGGLDDRLAEVEQNEELSCFPVVSSMVQSIRDSFEQNRRGICRSRHCSGSWCICYIGTLGQCRKSLVQFWWWGGMVVVSHWWLGVREIVISLISTQISDPLWSSITATAAIGFMLPLTPNHQWHQANICVQFVLLICTSIYW